MMPSSPNSEPSLLDLTSFPRAGVKGTDLSPWLTSRDFGVGDESNRAYLQSDGSLLIRLSPGELLLLTDPARPSEEVMSFPLEPDYTCYPVQRKESHYWFSISGEQCSDMLAKLCGVDLSPDNFPNHRVAQSSVAKTSAIIVRHDVGNDFRYYVLGDSSTAKYMKRCLEDAMAEFVCR